MDWEHWVTYMRDHILEWADEERARYGDDDRYIYGYANGLRAAAGMLTQILKASDCAKRASAKVALEAAERAVRDARESE